MKASLMVEPKSKDSWQIEVHSNSTPFLVKAFRGHARSENLGTNFL